MATLNITFIADPNEPNLYNDVTDLPDPFTMNIPIGITNTHTATLYFKATIVSAPGDYSDYTIALGSIVASGSTIFTYSPKRAQPSLTNGEYDETIDVQIQAYTDAGYSVPYGDKTLAVTVYHFNHTDGSWTVITHDTFDGEGTNGWGGINSGTTTTHFLSSPASFHAAYDQGQGYSWSAYKSQTVGNYSKARVVFHLRANGGTQYPEIYQYFEIIVDGVCKKPSGLQLPYDVWLRLSFNCFLNKTALIKVHNQVYNGHVWIDEFWIIAK